MNNMNLSPEKYSALIQMAAKKLGTNPNALKDQLESGQLDNLTKNLDPKQAAQLGSLLQNPKAIEAMLGNEKVRQMLGNALGQNK